MNKYFFTLRDFSKSGGGALRIRGMINALAANGISTTLVCTANQKNINVPSKLMGLDINFTPFEKKIFFLLLSFEITSFLVDIIFFSKLRKLAKFINKNNLRSERMLFCEYIDNSIGYYLKRKKIIDSYSIDLHGVAHVEFSHNKEVNFIQKIYYKVKYLSSIKLDEKVFSNAHTVVFASNTMRGYFIKLYPSIRNNGYQIIPYILSNCAKKKEVDFELFASIKKKYSLNNNDDIIFFAGGFKVLGGIFDLIHAFNKVLKEKPNSKLFLLGAGSIKDQLIALVNSYDINEQVIFAGVFPYEQLFTYQSLASVIVCPDIDNQYSNLIVHLKYFDSLCSGKIVINGNFDSVLEFNKVDNLSIGFEPSNINDLSEKILYVLDNKEALKEKYKDNQKYVSDNFIYNKYFDEILEI